MAVHPAIPTTLLESPSFQIERLRRRTRDEVESALTTKNTTQREFWVLSCLLTGSVSSQSTLCNILALDTSDMVRIIDALEQRSWVRRERDPRDRRKQIVTATEEGHDVYPELARLVSEAEDRALDESTTKQLKHLRKLAKAIIATEELAEENDTEDSEGS